MLVDGDPSGVVGMVGPQRTQSAPTDSQPELSSPAGLQRGSLPLTGSQREPSPPPGSQREPSPTPSFQQELNPVDISFPPEWLLDGPGLVFHGFCRRFGISYEYLKKRFEKAGLNVEKERDVQDVLTWPLDYQMSFLKRDVGMPAYLAWSMRSRLGAVVDAK